MMIRFLPKKKKTESVNDLIRYLLKFPKSILENDLATDQILIGNRDINFIIHLSEFLADNLKGQIGMVALLGEVGEVDVLQIGVSDFCEKLCALVIGEVALAAEDPLFVDGGAARGVNHRRLVVSFYIEIVTLLEVVFDKGRCKAKIGANAGFDAAGF